MGSTDWIIESNATLYVDSGIKYSGNSSFKVGHSGGITGITRGNNQQAKIILMIRDIGAINYGIVGHLAYGDISLSEMITETWEKWRARFWYDADNDTKWGKKERYEGGGWVQKGADINFGAGSPSANKIRLASYNTITDNYVWVDDIECYSESL